MNIAIKLPVGWKMCYKSCDQKNVPEEFIRDPEQNENRKKLIKLNKLKREQCDESIISSTSDSSEDLLIFDEKTEKHIFNSLIEDSLDISDEDYEGLNQLEGSRISELVSATARFNYPMGINRDHTIQSKST
ncbi:unnamed protein product [Oppiella nova]|uniref:Uncharacterized protein n=1 Tax=Oppiella nova TaxID=334625 RepID=A0A7R9QKQ4_9ACAR|nr:unnamed protein product [Oppiella nova]CAG2167906.1 unnamed protein product [Oppiella nova]